ncbi:dentin sialophosphoprotein [Musca vetustissima]|uniref:dentin sialophosphoprotein n=1 Tax=Musca vetustissima TaxID=27455 RepID=UPI002AB726C6|nr:dentin sialophosphoprotein [Musca vetustissima]
MANHEIIKNLMKKEGKPKLLQLINEQESILKESKIKSKDTATVPARNSEDVESSESQDSYLSVVNEMLEESYAEAMKNNKNETLANQEVGAEMEISVEDITEATNAEDKSSGETKYDSNEKSEDKVGECKEKQQATGFKQQSNITEATNAEDKSSGETKYDSNEKSEDKVGECKEKQQATGFKQQSNVSDADKSNATSPALEKSRPGSHERIPIISIGIKTISHKEKSGNKSMSEIKNRDFDKEYSPDEREFQGFAEDIIKTTVESNEQQMSTFPKPLEAQKTLLETKDKRKEILRKEINLTDANKRTQSTTTTKEQSKGIIRNPFVHRKVNNESTTVGSRKRDADDDKIKGTSIAANRNIKEKLQVQKNTESTEETSQGQKELVLKQDRFAPRSKAEIKTDSSKTSPKAEKVPKIFSGESENTTSKSNEKSGSSEQRNNADYKKNGDEKNATQREEGCQVKSKVSSTTENRLNDAETDIDKDVSQKSSEVKILEKKHSDVSGTSVHGNNAVDVEAVRTKNIIEMTKRQTGKYEKAVMSPHNKSESTNKISDSNSIGDSFEGNRQNQLEFKSSQTSENQCSAEEGGKLVNVLENKVDESMKIKTTLSSNTEYPSSSHTNNNQCHAEEDGKLINAQENKLNDESVKIRTTTLSFKKEPTSSSNTNDNKVDDKSPVLITSSDKSDKNDITKAQVNRVVDFESMFFGGIDKDQQQNKTNDQDIPKAFSHEVAADQAESNSEDHKKSIRKVKGTKRNQRCKNKSGNGDFKAKELQIKGSTRSMNISTTSATISSVEGKCGQTTGNSITASNKKTRKTNISKDQGTTQTNCKNVVTDSSTTGSVPQNDQNMASQDTTPVDQRPIIEKSVETTAIISGSPKKNKVSTIKPPQHCYPIDEKKNETEGANLSLNISDGNSISKKSGSTLDPVGDSKAIDDTKIRSLARKPPRRNISNKDNAKTNNVVKDLPKEEIKSNMYPLPQNKDDSPRTMETNLENAEQVRILRKRAMDSPVNVSKNMDILHKKPLLHVDMECNKKRVLRSPAHQSVAVPPKRTKLDRNVRAKNVTDKYYATGAMPSESNTDQSRPRSISKQINESVNPEENAQLEVANQTALPDACIRDDNEAKSVAETRSISKEVNMTVENLMNVSVNTMPVTKVSPTKKSIQTDKKRIRHSSNKCDLDNSSIPSSVLSFAEWLDKNKKIEPAEEKRVENVVENCRSRKSFKSKGISYKHGSHGPEICSEKGYKAEMKQQKADMTECETNIQTDGLSKASSSRSRSRMKRRTIGNTQQTSNIKQKIDVVRPSSASPTKGDKLKKRTEIEKLIESMSKEMKDGGIEDLLNRSDHVKRQRLSLKKNTSTDLVAAPGRTKADQENNNKTKTIGDIATNPSDNRPPKFKKPNVPKNQDLVLSIETEKALIDEIEIINMNSNFLKPLKCGSPIQVANGNQTQSSRHIHLNKSNISKPSNKTVHFKGCRKLKIRINRSFVNRYLRNLEKEKTAESLLRTENEKNANKKGTQCSTHPVQKDILSENRVPTVNNSVNIPKISSNCDVTILSTSEKNIGSSNHVLQPESGRGDATVSKVIQNVECPNEVMNGNSSALSGVPVELKHEFLDETPGGSQEGILPDTPTLMARSHSITQAAANALASTIIPTDIRLLTNDPLTCIHVPSFGVTPTLIDAKGTRMYTFLHPAKYSRNHGNVLLDYCCPNLDGPMPAIDPTRIHAQVQTPVVELPEFIVLTTKVVTRAELESNSSTIPEVIRKKAEKLRSSITNQNVQIAASGSSLVVPATDGLLLERGRTNPNQPQIPQQTLPTVMPLIMRPPHLTPAPHLSPALNALTKHLPSTTTITPKVRPALPPTSLSMSLPQAKVNPTTSISVVPKASDLLSDMQLELLRSNLRRFDVILKKLAQPFDKLSFIERHQIIENIIKSGKFLPKDLEWSMVFMEEYLKQVNSVSQREIVSLNNTNISCNTKSIPLPITQMTTLSGAQSMVEPKTSALRTNASCPQFEVGINQNTGVRKQQLSSTKNVKVSVNTSNIRKRQVPIYDTEKNIIGYQLQVITPTNSATSSSKAIGRRSEGMLMPEIRTAPKRAAQGSPQIFYTTPPLQTSVHPGHLNPTSSSHQHGSIVTTMRSSGSATAGTETITTTTMAVKRVTRSRAAGSKIIIMSKSNNNEEAILPDVSHRTEIKNEQDDANEFAG